MNDTTHHLKFTTTHEWIKTDEHDMTVGITEHAQQLLGDMVFVNLPDIGQHVSAGDEVGVVESVKAASDYYAPISGTVVAINSDVNEDPSLVNQDPFGAGWLIKIKADHPEELNTLLDAKTYHNDIVKDE